MSRAFKVHDIPGQSIDNVNWKAVASGSGAVVTTDGTQSLTNKTVTSPVVTGGTFAGGTFTEPIITADVQAALAAAGSAIGDAAAITATAPGIVTSTGGNNAAGIKLPTGNPGDVYWVHNLAADILFVYPAVNCSINAIAANTKINMATVTSAAFTKINSTLWVTSPRVPS